MNQFINMEVKFFLMSVAWGAILLVMYDCLRILRKVVKHGAVLMSIEDIIYWTISSVLIFRMMYQLNDGIIRGFSLLGILLGMVLYKYTISDYVVKGISFVLIKIKMFIKKVIHIILKPLKFMGMQGKKLFLAISSKMKLGMRHMYHMIKNYIRTLRKSLQSRKKRVRMKKSDSNFRQEANLEQITKFKKKHREKIAVKQSKRLLAEQEEKSKQERRQKENAKYMRSQEVKSKHVWSQEKQSFPKVTSRGSNKIS